jgi:hypothetical protein
MPLQLYPFLATCSATKPVVVGALAQVLDLVLAGPSVSEADLRSLDLPQVGLL